jgi:hypothetical protein
MIYSKENPDFKFEYKKNYDVSTIKTLVEKLQEEWFLDTSRQDTMFVHRHTQSYILRKVSIVDWTKGSPLKQLDIKDDTEIWKETLLIIKDLEEMCEGVVSQALYINLPAKKTIPPHEDAGEYFFHVRRHHIPIITNPGVDFFIEGDTKNMKEGECWEINHSRTHAVFNEGDEDRIHLLIDIIPRKALPQ